MFKIEGKKTVSILVDQISPYLVKTLGNSTLTGNLNLCIFITFSFLFNSTYTHYYRFSVSHYIRNVLEKSAYLRQTVVTET